MGNEKNPVVLTIDDEPVIRESLRNYLEDCDYVVLEADNGRTGLEIFERENPDLVLVDLRMPEIDGLDVLAKVREASPNTPVIVVSGTGAIGDVVEALRFGAWDYLLKPIEDMVVLRHSVEASLQRSQLLRDRLQYQEHLEEEVRKRTHELEASNQSLMREIAVRKETETALRQSEETFRALAENSRDTIMRFDRSFRHLYVNPIVESQTGIPAKDFLGKKHRELGFPENLIEQWELAIQCVFERGKPNRIEFQLPTGVWVDWQLVPEFSSDGKVQAVIASARDITERKRAEEERASMEAQLRQAQKMEAIGQLAGGVAHDFNNLLAVIQGYTDLAMAEISPENPLNQQLTQVLNASSRAASLVRQLLTFSRRDEIQPKKLNLSEVIGNLFKMLRRVIGEQINLEVSCDPNLRAIYADPVHMEQILMNLCVNSRDAMPGGGQITIRSQNATIDRGFCKNHSWAREGDFVLLSVSDTGVGMTREVLEHIFEPFFTTKEAVKGTGLGLATVYGIVKQHEGLVNVSSQPDKGTTFSIYIPAVDSDIEDREENVSEDRAQGGNETILVAEDEELVRTLTVRVLEGAGYRVLVACDGNEAIELFERHSEEISLSVLDVVMPGKSGRAVFDYIKAIKPEAAVLFITGYSSEILRSESVLEEECEVLRKPYSTMDLLRKVRQQLS